MHYLIEPGVPGQLGDSTKLDTSCHPPIAHELEIVIDDWLGDDVLEIFPCYFISENLKDTLETSQLTGFNVKKVENTYSELFYELNGDTEVPLFYWLYINGTPEQGDFWINKDHLLAVSEKAYEILQNFNLAQADIEFINYQASE